MYRMQMMLKTAGRLSNATRNSRHFYLYAVHISNFGRPTDIIDVLISLVTLKLFGRC